MTTTRLRVAEERFGVGKCLFLKKIGISAYPCADRNNPVVMGNTDDTAHREAGRRR